MAILTIPFLGMHLVQHVGGGAILHAGGGFVANAFIPATVVEAFGVASGVLANMGSSSLALVSGAVSNPIVLGIAALAVVAIGGYCYFHGIPAPIEATLSGAGLGTATKQGFMVSVPQLAVALILLGGAGYVGYRFYKNFRSLKVADLIGAAPEVQTKPQAEAVVREAFGEEAWTRFGTAIWSGVEDAGRAAKMTAQDAVSLSAEVANKLVETATGAAAYSRDAIESAASSVTSLAVAAGSSGQSVFRGAVVSVGAGSEHVGRFLAGLKEYFPRGT